MKVSCGGVPGGIQSPILYRPVPSIEMLVKTSTVLCALTVVAFGAPNQLPIDKHRHSGVDRDPITIRCGTGSNTEACPARYKCTAPPNCERYFQGVYYEGCIGTCVPDMPPI
ncbi:hypothetical protein A9K55_001342 [Cordyceps militaris]|uniref:Uncharacterized protein n=1 Tax=Cordyceps militaris TaxID=73501 RepID=A0A2H4SQP9_CORMI|nr:hypothetical protein A9K55_001342 [Cordyceps militaris]